MRKAACDALTHWGDDRSGHQAEPLPCAHDLDLLDHKVEPTRLPAAGCEEHKPEEELAIRVMFCVSWRLILSPVSSGLQSRRNGLWATVVVLTGNTHIGTDR